MRHRGPDGSGFSIKGNWSLGMNRLAIQDVEKGQQPFGSKDGKVTVVCNGEIYNWKDLRKELEALGHQFSTRCDAEILPAAWQEWGTGMFLRLNGMFALAIQDGERLVLARDRCGQKPIYYTSGGNLVFSSEIKGLVAAGVGREADPSALMSYLMLRYVPEPRTVYRGIVLLPAGTWMEVGSREITRYWQPAFTERRTNYREAVDELKGLVESAISRSSQPDVPMAAYLSAGVDSSLLVRQMQEQGRAFQTVSIGFGAENDETPEAEAFAKRLGLEHHPVVCSPMDLDSMPRVVSQMERPVGDLLTIAFDKLASVTRGLGCPVAVGGEGADELFGGYSFHKQHALCERLGPVVTRMIGLGIRKAPLEILNRVSEFPAAFGQASRAKVADFFHGYGEADSWWRGVGLRTLFTPEELAALLSPELLQTLPDLPDVPGAQTDVERHLGYQFSGWLQDWALIRQDKNAMAHSVEYRAPFLDSELLDFSFSIPTSWKISWRADKKIWRGLAPAGFIQREKQPFYLPIEREEWRLALQPWIEEAFGPGGLERTGWFRDGSLRRLKDMALRGGDFYQLKQLASLVILHLHICE